MPKCDFNKVAKQMKLLKNLSDSSLRISKRLTNVNEKQRVQSY